MLVYLTALNEHQEDHRFCCHCRELETIFELLDHIVARGHTLMSVSIVEKDQQWNLPPDAFETHSMLAAFKELTLQWTAVLAQPVPIHPDLTLQQIQWFSEKIVSYEENIVRLELMITSIDRAYQRAEAALGLSDQPNANPYQPVMCHYTAQLRHAQQTRQHLFERLPHV